MTRKVYSQAHAGIVDETTTQEAQEFFRNPGFWITPPDAIRRQAMFEVKEQSRLEQNPKKLGRKASPGGVLSVTTVIALGSRPFEIALLKHPSGTVKSCAGCMVGARVR